MTTNNLTYAPLEISDQVAFRRHSVRKKGEPTAWAMANKFISLKRGYPLMIGGLGGVGKSEFAFDIVLNYAIMHNKIGFIMSPETGDKYEIMEMMCEKISNGEVLEHGNKYRPPIEKRKFERMATWLNKFFRIFDVTDNWDENYRGLPLNMDNLFSAVDEEEKRLKRTFDLTFIDPLNEMDIEAKSDTVKNELNRYLYWTKDKNYLSILTNHINDQQMFREKDENGEWRQWMPPAPKEKWSFGQQLAKKGYQMLQLWEPPEFKVEQWANEGDIEAQHALSNAFNMREVYVQKSKPKGVGKTGKFRAFYDRDLQRYYTLDSIGMKEGLIWPTL